MARGIDPDAQLDYAEFELFSSQNRYEVCVCSGIKVETVESGLLEQLLLHSPDVQNLHSKRLNASFKIHLPNAITGAAWFTKSILTRFLRIVGSPDILDISKNFENEISQLEETRKFQVSMNSHLNRLGSGETDGGRLNSTTRAAKAEVGSVSSDASKNELLRAMDLRLAALRDELVSSFLQTTGTSCSSKEITDLHTFSHYFGAINIRNSLRKFMELSQVGHVVDVPDSEKFLFTSRNEKTNNTNGNMQTSRSSPLDTPVKYGVSPAKVAQLERQSSTDESSLSSEDDQPSVERSRPIVRSATPRRSASPMRRVQIGRSGSRRASAVTIKSLNHFSGRERLLSQIDAANSDEEGSEQPPRKSDNKQRISVQAAISLFENKQKDQIVDVPKMRSSFNASSTIANKSVLRRWSSGMSASSVHCPVDSTSESSDQTNLNNTAGPEISHDSQDIQEPDSRSGRQTHVDILVLDSRSESSDNLILEPSAMSADTVSNQQEESNGKFTASAEWSQQKEAELNQLLASMMENKPVKYQKKSSDNNQKKNVPGENRGGFYDHYKQKRDDKLRGEVSGKRAEKEAQLKTMQKFFEERKAEMASTNAKDVGRRHTISTSQKSTKTSPTTKPKKEIAKPAAVKKTSSKASLPATRKSWPSTPLPRTVGSSPAKTPAGTSTSGTAPKRSKPQSVSSLPRSSPNVERSKPKPNPNPNPNPNPKTVKGPQFDSKKSVKGMNEKQQTTKIGKITKTKMQTPSGIHSSPTKPSLYNKVTKKSSVVPLESKPFLRKGSRIAAGVSPVVKSKVSSLPEESMKESKDEIKAEERELATSNLSAVCLEDTVDEMEIYPNKEPESQVTIEKSGDTGSSSQVTACFDDNVESLAESTVKTGDEEVSVISPAAWVEMEEYQDESIMYVDRSTETATAANVAAVKVTSPRVRHSLSQMLLEETSECDTAEWGNAENPPTMVHQKDAPKGLKRLLKFARKSKLDASSGWSSPSGFSEGEDEAEESKTSKKNAENLLRKAALNAKNYGPQRTDSYESYEKYSAPQSGVNNLTTERANKLQESHIGASVTASKASRSFFSLSAFKGSKT